MRRRLAITAAIAIGAPLTITAWALICYGIAAIAGASNPADTISALFFGLPILIVLAATLLANLVEWVRFGYIKDKHL